MAPPPRPFRFHLPLRTCRGLSVPAIADGHTQGAPRLRHPAGPDPSEACRWRRKKKRNNGYLLYDWSRRGEIADLPETWTRPRRLRRQRHLPVCSDMGLLRAAYRSRASLVAAPSPQIVGSTRPSRSICVDDSACCGVSHGACVQGTRRICLRCAVGATTVRCLQVHGLCSGTVRSSHRCHRR